MSGFHQVKYMKVHQNFDNRISCVLALPTWTCRIGQEIEENCDRSIPRFALCGPLAARPSGIYSDRRADPGPRHRSKHSYFQQNLKAGAFRHNETGGV